MALAPASAEARLGTADVVLETYSATSLSARDM